MTVVSKKTSQIIELHYENLDGQVRVVTPNKHIMAMPVEMAVEACRAFNDQIIFKDQFDCLLSRLASWINDHESMLLVSYLTARDDGLLFLVVQNGKRRNKDLEKALSELDLEIANDADYSLIRLCVLAIPECTEEAQQSFLSPKIRFRYVGGHGKRS